MKKVGYFLYLATVTTSTKNDWLKEIRGRINKVSHAKKTFLKSKILATKTKKIVFIWLLYNQNKRIVAIFEWRSNREKI